MSSDWSVGCYNHREWTSLANILLVYGTKLVVREYLDAEGLL